MKRLSECKTFFKGTLLFALVAGASVSAVAAPLDARAVDFLKKHCFDCHDGAMAEGGLNLEALSSASLSDENFSRWVKVHDRVENGEMPPPKKKRPGDEDKRTFLKRVSTELAVAERKEIGLRGRSMLRRLNRFEFENSLRDALNAPWLQVADMLPEDGIAHLFNKSGERLDISHVQIARFLEAGESALRAILQTVAHPAKTKRFYAREEPVMNNYLRYRFGQTAAVRAAIPLLGTTPEPDVVRGKQPLTVGESDPERREREAMGFVCGTYTATTKYDFTRMNLPVDGRYRLRIKTYTFQAGPNGADGGDDHGLTGGNAAWWKPSRTMAFPGARTEPVTLYALADSGDSRWLTTFDSHPEPQVIEREVYLRKGEKIRPDASRLVRTRPGWKGNPLATTNGSPGLALNWLEIEGPLHAQWPPESFKAAFGKLAFEVGENHRVRLVSGNESLDARQTLQHFMQRVTRSPAAQPGQVEPAFKIYQRARELGEDFTDAMVAAMASVLCSSDFLFLNRKVGPLSEEDLATRLALFLWNGPPDATLRSRTKLSHKKTLRAETERLLNDAKSDRFQRAFLDYWLNLREINANTPDAELYPDYYLDDLLTESSVLETRLFFRELIERDLPARTLIDSPFTFANESLARHYGLPPFEGVELRRVELPRGGIRGGLLTQASVLRVTANGTTTSPVIRGSWVMERIMGLEIPPPPSGIEAITPDTRGATTIRQQLDKHRAAASCAACHAKFDPVGFALESFDIAGGWRERYRAIGTESDSVQGLGKNGHEFRFRLAQKVDSAGQLLAGPNFANVAQLRGYLVEDDRAVARNLVHRLVAYATGAPVSFGERAAVEKILDSAAPHYGVRSLVHAVVQSDLFRLK